MSPGAEQDECLLDHVAQCIDRIRQYTEGSRERFMESILVQDAVIRNLQVLAESTTRLSEQLRSTEPLVPWAKIRGFRNVVTHAYLNIDQDVVWGVVEGDLPELDDAIRRMQVRNESK